MGPLSGQIIKAPPVSDEALPQSWLILIYTNRLTRVLRLYMQLNIRGYICGRMYAAAAKKKKLELLET